VRTDGKMFLILVLIVGVVGFVGVLLSCVVTTSVHGVMNIILGNDHFYLYHKKSHSYNNIIIICLRLRVKGKMTIL
jgi:hypothetical protein